VSIERLKAALADRYAIERELGSGGMATVYLATDRKHDRQVAIKVLRLELAATLGAERFLREVQVTANLQHPHILPLFDSGEAGGFLYYVMPYVEGESLRARLDREGELPVPEAVRILKEVVDALAAAHAQGLVHRDVKPANVMLAGRHAMVVDFGVAKALSEAAGPEGLTTAGLVLGTLSYMAPEQAEGSAHIDHRADLYAVGVMGYELLTGRTPFEGRTPQQILMAQVMETPQPVTELRPAVPAGLSAVLARCLERKPADRWQTAEELLAQLDAFVTTGEGVTPPQPLPVGAKRPGAVRRWLPAAGVMGLAALGAALYLGRDSTGADAEGDASRATAGAGGAAADASVLRLVVAPLQNVSGDPSWDSWSTIAVEEISRAVERTGVVDVVPWTVVLDVIRTRGDTATVATLASETNATYAVAGTIARAGPEVRFAALIQDAGGGGLSTRIEPVTGPPDSLAALIRDVGARVAAALVAELDPDRPAWTASERLAPSPEVLEHYTASLDLFCRGSMEESIAIGDRALALAPDYVPQLMMNAYAYRNARQPDAADSVLALMEPLRDQMTSAERAEMDLVTAWRDDDEARALQVGRRHWSGSSWSTGRMRACATGRLGGAWSPQPCIKPAA
jgi:TolB-like protein